MSCPRLGVGSPWKEGAGNAGCALHPRSRVQWVEGNAHEHTGSAEALRHSLRNGFTAYFALSPATNSFCHRHQRIEICLKPGRADASPLAWHQQRMPGPHAKGQKGTLRQLRDDQTPQMQRHQSWSRCGGPHLRAHDPAAPDHLAFLGAHGQRLQRPQSPCAIHDT